MSAKEEQSTGSFNSLVFHTNSAVDFRFAGISVMVSDRREALAGGGGANMSAIIYDGLLLMCRSWSVEAGVQLFTLMRFNTPLSSCFIKHCFSLTISLY